MQDEMGEKWKVHIRISQAAKAVVKTSAGLDSYIIIADDIPRVSLVEVVKCYCANIILIGAKYLIRLHQGADHIIPGRKRNRRRPIAWKYVSSSNHWQLPCMVRRDSHVNTVRAKCRPALIIINDQPRHAIRRLFRIIVYKHLTRATDKNRERGVLLPRWRIEPGSGPSIKMGVEPLSLRQRPDSN